MCRTSDKVFLDKAEGLPKIKQSIAAKNRPKIDCRKFVEKISHSILIALAFDHQLIPIGRVGMRVAIMMSFRRAVLGRAVARHFHQGIGVFCARRGAPRRFRLHRVRAVLPVVLLVVHNLRVEKFAPDRAGEVARALVDARVGRRQPLHLGAASAAARRGEGLFEVLAQHRVEDGIDAGAGVAERLEDHHDAGDKFAGLGVHLRQDAAAGQGQLRRGSIHAGWVEDVGVDQNHLGDPEWII